MLLDDVLYLYNSQMSNLYLFFIFLMYPSVFKFNKKNDLNTLIKIFCTYTVFNIPTNNFQIYLIILLVRDDAVCCPILS